MLSCHDLSAPLITTMRLLYCDFSGLCHYLNRTNLLYMVRLVLVQSEGNVANRIQKVDVAERAIDCTVCARAAALCNVNRMAK